jgi:hypothetical protein
VLCAIFQGEFSRPMAGGGDEVHIDREMVGDEVRYGDGWTGR